MKKYLYLILWLSFGCKVSTEKKVENNFDSLKQSTSIQDSFKNATKPIESGLMEDGSVPPFNIEKAKLIDSITNPNAYLYDQKYEGPASSVYSKFNV